MVISIERYKAAVEWLCKDRSSTLFPNSSPEHASVVLATMIKNAQNEVKIYDDNLDGSIGDLDNTYMVDAMRDFIKDENKKLKIVIRDDRYYDTKIYHFLAENIKTHSNIEIKKANTCFINAVVKIYNRDINFAVGDNYSFRMEKVESSNDQASKKEAICSFNREDQATKLSNVFDECYDSCPDAELN